MKITVKHMHLRSTDRLDSHVEAAILDLGSRLKISQAQVVLERRHGASPLFYVQVQLENPGPDLFAQARDHSARAAFDKALASLQAQLDSRSKKRIRRIRSNLQEPAHFRHSEGRPVTRG